MIIPGKFGRVRLYAPFNSDRGLNECSIPRSFWLNKLHKK